MARESRKRKGREAPVRIYVEGRPVTLHKATGQGYVTLKREDGRRHRVYVGALYLDAERRTLNQEALDRARRLLHESEVLGGAAPREPEALTVRALVTRHAAHAKQEYGEASREPEIFRHATRLLLDLYGDTEAHRFGPLALRAVRSRMLEEDLAGPGEEPRRYARKTVNDYVARIVRVFKWAASHELVPAAVYHALATVPGLRRGRTAARESARRHPIPREHIDRTLPRLPGVVRAMVEVQLFAAMRPGEVCAMRPADIDRSGEVWLYRPASHKNEWRGEGYGRVVALGPQAQAVLRPFLLRPDDACCFSPREAQEQRRQARHAARKTPPHHGNTRGSNRKRRPRRAPADRYDVHAYRRCVARACRAAGVPSWTPGRLRHTAASELRRRYGLELARLVCGHRSAVVTAAHYAEADRERLLRIAREVG